MVLMIWNPARLPPEWTLERLLAKHFSDPFNPDVANTFFHSGQIESWGRGIERMVQTCLDEGMAAPVFKVEPDGVWVTFEFLPPHGAASAKTTVETRVETTVETRVKVPDESTSGTQIRTPQRILATLEANPQLTLSEMAVLLDKSLSAIERATAKLVKEGKLRFVGPKKGGRWEVLK